MDDKIARFAELVAVVERLRGPQGCPWDREQTHASLRTSLLEESYEVLEAIEGESAPRLREELGDLLLQVLMHAVIAEEAGTFGLGEVSDSIREKLVRRHPHVFGSVTVSGPEEAVHNWETLKATEYARESALDGVQRTLPALQWALSLQRRAAHAGFDWPDVSGPLEKIVEELAEIQAAESDEQRESEVGDLLFTIVNVARHMRINPEDALRGATGRFETRFRSMEGAARTEGRSLKQMTLGELDRRWEAAKAGE